MAGRKANFTWNSLPGQANLIWTATAAGATSFITLGTFERSETIRRLIVDFYAQTPSEVDSVSWSGRAGIIIVAPPVASVGSTAMPGPGTDGERPWLWNRTFAGNQEVNSTGWIKAVPLHLHDDVRGMRKFKDGDALISVIENSVTTSIETLCGIRLLSST